MALALGVGLAANAGDSTTGDPNKQGAGAQRLMETEASASTTARPGDPSSFVKEAVKGNEAEVALGELAERKAQNQQVKDLAAMLRKEHTEANQQLRSLAQQHKVPLNQPLEAKHKEEMQKLQRLSGPEFDKEYVKAMLKDHQKDIQVYQRAAQNLDDPAAKQYAQTTLPKLQSHLQHAKSAAQAIGIDQATISSILKESPEAMGGTADDSGKSTGHESMDDRNTPRVPPDSR